MNGLVGIIRGLRKKPDLPKLAGSSNPEARPFRVVQHYLKGYPFVALASELRRGPLTPDMAWLSGPLTKPFQCPFTKRFDRKYARFDFAEPANK